MRLPALLLYPALACAAVTQIHVIERSDVLNLPYERITATAHFAVDPKLPANRVISDIDLAPRNEQGLVEFSADLYVLKPRNPATANGTVLFEVSNRGGKGMLGMFNRAKASADPRTDEDFGDRFLLEQGYTLVWLGWQFDVPKREGVLRLYTPVASGVTGVIRADFVVNKAARSLSVADRNHLPYAAVDPNDPTIQLTVRDHPLGARRVMPRDKWQFAREENGGPVADAAHVYLAEGFQPGKVYEVVYQTKDPALVGLGPAAIRDLISFLKHGGASGPGSFLLADQRQVTKRAIGFGTSQSGRFLRTFLYYGFNADEKGRIVFDGVWAHVAGAGRGSFNHRFAQPSRDGHPMMNFFYPTDIFPFTDMDETDPETGLTAGLLDRAAKDKVVPKIFYTNGSYEYWGRAASLIHTTADGKHDAPLAPGTRIYLLAGTQHGAGAFPPRRNNTVNLSNPNDYRFTMRALLNAMNLWLKDGKEPPASVYPRIDKDQLVTLSAAHFPKIPGAQFPTRMHQAWRVDYGPDFATKGIVTKEPPEVGKPFATLVPQVDDDGNDMGGIRLPEVQHPLGTYTGWNLRDPAIGGAGELYDMVGSWFPLPKNAAERAERKDPRPSAEERYQSREQYLRKIAQSAKDLAAQGFVLERDIPLLMARAASQWSYVSGN